MSEIQMQFFIHFIKGKTACFQRLNAFHQFKIQLSTTQIPAAVFSERYFPLISFKPNIRHK